MTKKDYIVIAACINRAKVKGGSLEYFQEQITRELAADNGRFDARRFHTACDPQFNKAKTGGQ